MGSPCLVKHITLSGTRPGRPRGLVLRCVLLRRLGDRRREGAALPDRPPDPLAGPQRGHHQLREPGHFLLLQPPARAVQRHLPASLPDKTTNGDAKQLVGFLGMRQPRELLTGASPPARCAGASAAWSRGLGTWGGAGQGWQEEPMSPFQAHT